MSEAETMAREAIQLVEDTDLVDLYADAMSDLAEIYRMSGRIEEQTTYLTNALRVYERREHLVGADRARSLLDVPQRS